MARFANKGNEISLQIFRDGLSTPWGFRLQGGVDYESHLTVQRVVPLSAVDGHLIKGDIIIKIDDYDATRLTHDVALQLISSAGSSLKLTILRKPTSTYGSAYRNVRSLSTPLQFRNLSSPTDELNEQDDKLPKLPDIMKQSLQLKEKGLLDTIRTHNYSRPTTPSIQAWPPPKSNMDITSFLPKPPPKRLLQMSRSGRDPQLRSQVRDSMMFRSPLSSGRSTPTTSTVLELGGTASPIPGSPRPVGVWQPPLHQPNAKLVHLQYNSPMNVYSANNVADTVEKMTGSKLHWLSQPPPTRYLDDIRDSPTYKFVQEMEGRTPSRMAGPYEQSATIKSLNKYFNLDDSSNF